MSDIGHVIETVLVSTVPIFLYMWSNRRQAKSDMTKRHEENQEKMNEILNERKYLPAHGHSERSGPLHAECITRPPE